jgi:hypothetical protein
MLAVTTLGGPGGYVSPGRAAMLGEPRLSFISSAALSGGRLSPTARGPRLLWTA